MGARPRGAVGRPLLPSGEQSPATAYFTRGTRSPCCSSGSRHGGRVAGLRGCLSYRRASGRAVFFSLRSWQAWGGCARVWTPVSVCARVCVCGCKGHGLGGRSAAGHGAPVLTPRAPRGGVCGQEGPRCPDCLRSQLTDRFVLSSSCQRGTPVVPPEAGVRERIQPPLWLLLRTSARVRLISCMELRAQTHA